MTLSPEAQAVAEARAARDRDDLARLLRERRVGRDFTQYRTMLTEGETVAQFRADVESRVRPTVNLAIKSKKRRRR